MDTHCPECQEPLYLRRLVYQINPVVNSDPDCFEVEEHVDEWDSEEHPADLFCRRCGYTEPFTGNGFDVV